MIRGAAVGVAVLVLSTPLPAWAQVLEMPAGARLMQDQSTDPDSYLLPTAAWDGRLPTLSVEGAVNRQAWRIEGAGLSTLQVLAPLRDQLHEAGYEILLECETEACGGFDFRFSTEVLPAPAMYVDLGDFRFLAAQKEDEAVGLMISRTSRDAFVQVIRAAPSDAPPLAAAAAAGSRGTMAPEPDNFGALLDTEGRVILSDLGFETGSAQLGAGPYASLGALADYLALDENRTVALVGHTDSQGPLDGNITLSRRRAGSVLERLVEEFGTPRSQLEAHGMGYLAPVASNLTAEGRDANRRVEVIILSGG